MQPITQLSQNLKIHQKGFLLVGIPLVFQVMFLAVLVTMLSGAERETLQEASSKSLIADVHKLDYTFMEMNSCASQYFTTRRPDLYERINRLYEQTKEDLKDLKKRSLGSEKNAETLAEEERILSKVDDLNSQLYKFLTSLKQMLDEGGEELDLYRSSDLLQKAANLAIQTTEQLDRFVAVEEPSRQETLKKATENRIWVKRVLAAGVAINVLMGLFLAIYFNRDTVARLKQLMLNMKNLAGRQSLDPAMTGQDEIAEVDRFFHQMADELDQLDRIKRDFFAMASHDLRTPLSSLHLFLGGLKGGIYGDLSSNGEERTLSMERTTKRMIRLVNDLLDLEKLEQGKLEVEIMPAELSEVIEQSLETVRDLAENRLIDLVAPDTVLKVMADSERLVQVMVNLLSNAIKFSPEGSTVTIEIVKDSPEVVKISVADEGPGIPEQQKDLVFERYKQLPTPAGKKRSGTGLGLPVCREIIKLHKGEIGFESQEGKGTTFWFTIPQAAGQ